MKNIIFCLGLVFVGLTHADTVSIGRNQLGSGTPGTTGLENAVPWNDNIYHAPQYLPGYPTAATIYPRVMAQPCKRVGDAIQCDGYNWNPGMGRGEYLMIQPTVVAEPPPPVVVPPDEPPACEPNIYTEVSPPEIILVPVEKYVYRSEPIEKPRVLPPPRKKIKRKECSK